MFGPLARNLKNLEDAAQHKDSITHAYKMLLTKTNLHYT